MKKLLSLFVLLVAFVTGAWAAKPEISGITLPDAPTTALDLASQEIYTADENGWIVFSPKADGVNNNTDYWSCNATNGNSRTWTSPSGATAPFQGGSSKTCYALQTARVHALTFTGAESFSVLGKSGGTGRYVHVALYTYDGTTFTLIEDKSDNSNSEVEFLYESLTTSTTYVAYFYGSATSNSDLFEVALKAPTAPAGPAITTQPQSAAYATGDPIAALTVEATASAGDLEYQWYTCDDAEKTNAVAIDGATSASYTPTAAGFYYVNVADENGDIDSDVAEITISAAEAPTINVTGAPADDVVVGTEVILTAETTGTPTPTVTWYDGDTDEEISTGATYTVPTDVAGTFSIYAVASNGVEPDATSSVQTIVVKEQAAKPTFDPNGAYFQESQEVAIATTTEDATIQYSVDNGATWADYTEAFTVTETTTIQAKAVKAGYIDSETATATFTLVTLDPQVDVTEAATWDWSKFGTTTIQLTAESTPSKTTEFVLSNAVNYGLCSSIGANFGNAQQLKVTTEYVVREGKYWQGGSIKFNTTVPGEITVVYSNTGTRTDEAQRRFLNVNGINYGVGTMTSKSTTTTTVSVAAGEVAITGKFGPSVEDQADQYLRINSITFTPTSTETVTIPEEGVATYVTKSALDFSTQNGAFKAYAVTNVGETSATTAEVGAVPAGTPLLIKGAAGDYDVEIVESADDIENLLQVSNGTVTGGDNIYAYSKTALKFKKVAATVKIPAGKCYLQANGGDALDIIFDGEATGINDVNAGAEAAAPVKVLTAKGVQIGKFNVAGQQVK